MDEKNIYRKGVMKGKRNCKYSGCKKEFLKERPLQSTCSISCAINHSKDLQLKKSKKETIEKKKALLTHKDYLGLLQKVFNTWVRMRDKDKPCVSCGVDMKNRKGDASHFYSVGSTPSLRFNELNVHLACVPCNQYNHGNLHEYAERLPLRIGKEAFESLKDERFSTLKLSIDEIKEKIKEYKLKIKELNK
jgi:hypothetical protein